MKPGYLGGGGDLPLPPPKDRIGKTISLLFCRNSSHFADAGSDLDAALHKELSKWKAIDHFLSSIQKYR